jgi:hypothetical protein
MTARIPQFSPIGPFTVHVEREAEAWIVICRSHAWLFGSRHAAMTETNGIASGHGVAVVVNA